MVDSDETRSGCGSLLAFLKELCAEVLPVGKVLAFRSDCFDMGFVLDFL